MTLAVLGVSLAYSGDPGKFQADIFVNVLGLMTLFAYATVGALIASRRPENPIGWLFCLAALSVQVGVFAGEYARYALLTKPGSLPGGLAMAWLAAWPRTVGFTIMFTFLILLFPDGRLPSERWRWVAWLSVGVIVSGTLWDAIRPGGLAPIKEINNPLGIEALGEAADFLTTVWALVTYITIGLCVASVVARFRRATGDERQQIKWFAYAAVLTIVQFAITAVAETFKITALSPSTSEAFFILTTIALPIAAGVAILKYHLYDIDLLINRTLVYIPLTGILAGLYTASIAFFQRLFVAVTGEHSDAAIVITALILASSFTPIKNWLQGIVDKRFKEVPDPTKKLRAFTQEVGSYVQMSSPEQLAQRLLDEAVAAFDAKGGAVYLGRDGQNRLAYASEGWNEAVAMSVPLESSGERVGLISLGERRNGAEYTAKDRELVESTAGVVAQAIGFDARAG
jgi:hypothetical protein